MPIRLFVTGGTFDKEYDEIEGKLYFKDTHVKEMLTRARSRLQIEVRTIMMVDSLEMSDADRELIVKHCQSAEEKRILITHGTDTMEVTAEVLGHAITDKTVVLTGAMVPYKFGSSDGLFNLGSALAFVQTLPHGVYVAMNGRCFPWDSVRKNRKTGEFEEVNPRSE
jgi:L-asparaginase